MVECQACRCGLCCGGWPIVATEQDVEREPLIRGCRRNGQEEYLLNRPGKACRFFEKDLAVIGHCTIYPTRPAVSRQFKCEGVQGQLIQENPGRFYFDSEEEGVGVRPGSNGMVMLRHLPQRKFSTEQPGGEANSGGER